MPCEETGTRSGEQHVEREAEVRVMVPQAKGGRRLSVKPSDARRKAWNGAPSQPQKEPTLSQTSNSQDSERINVRCLSHTVCGTSYSSPGEQIEKTFSTERPPRWKQPSRGLVGPGVYWTSLSNKQPPQWRCFLHTAVYINAMGSLTRTYLLLN